MWIENEILREDLENISMRKEISWSVFVGKTILITGATGLIGYTVLCALIYATRSMEEKPKILLLVRDIEKAKIRFEKILRTDSDRIIFVLGDVSGSWEINESVDYIIHGASPTASKFFVEHPVETIKTAIHGTENMLELARNKGVKGFVYLSSMEVYGKGNLAGAMDESYVGDVDPLSVRNCYPESKRMCENMCISYRQQYGVPVKIARLSQTFGPGVSSNDVRVFAEFARCALAKKDIVLKTDGLSERMCLYTADAAAAILCLLTREDAAGAYNIANENTFSSIRETAQVVINILANGLCKLYIPENNDDEAIAKYPPKYRLELDTSRMKALGWRATYNQDEMYIRMVKTWKK